MTDTTKEDVEALTPYKFVRDVDNGNQMLPRVDGTYYRRKDVETLVSGLLADRDHWKSEFDAAHLTGYEAAKAEMREALIAAEAERDDAMTLFHAADKKMRALAAERDAALAGAVRVKPLAWAAFGKECIRAETELGCYEIIWGFRNGQVWLDVPNIKGSNHVWHPAADLAKAAAQADYDARIRAAMKGADHD